MRITATACATCGQLIRLAQFTGEARHERAIALQATPVVALVLAQPAEAWEVRRTHPVHQPYCGAVLPEHTTAPRRRRNGTRETQSWDPMDRLVRAVGDS